MRKLGSLISGMAIGVGTLPLGLALDPANAHAQVRVELTPFVGSYYALSNLGRQAANEKERQANQPALGAVLFARLTPVIGVEGAFAFTASGTNVTSTGTVTNQGYSGNIIFASGRVRLSVPRTNLYGLAGAGIVRRGGQAWNSPVFTKLTNVAGVVGAGTRAEVSAAVRIDVKAEAQFYSLDPDGSGTAYASKLQTDVIFGVGIPISFSRH